MTKYSTELKIKVISKYLNHANSLLGLEKKYLKRCQIVYYAVIYTFFIIKNDPRMVLPTQVVFDIYINKLFLHASKHLINIYNTCLTRIHRICIITNHLTI
jgi:hypothetical protein